MNRITRLLPVAAIGLAMTVGCTADNATPGANDTAVTGTPLERFWQDIAVQVAVPTGGYRFDVAGRCGLDGQTIYAEGTSRNAEFSIHVSRDPASGLVVFFSNREDEWEIMLPPGEDTSEIDRKNIFHFSGEAMRNGDESVLEPLEIRFHCKEF